MLNDFTENGSFEVSREDFIMRTEPRVLKDAGPIVIQNLREASAEYLMDAPNDYDKLKWTVTQHPDLGVFTVHYVYFDYNTQTYTGKCLFGAIGWLPENINGRHKPWLPISAFGGALVRYDGYTPSEEHPEPPSDNFLDYTFSGWIPRYVDLGTVAAAKFLDDADGQTGLLKYLVGIGYSYKDAHERIVPETRAILKGMRRTIPNSYITVNALANWADITVSIVFWNEKGIGIFNYHPRHDCTNYPSIVYVLHPNGVGVNDYSLDASTPLPTAVNVAWSVDWLESKSLSGLIDFDYLPDKAKDSDAL